MRAKAWLASAALSLAAPCVHADVFLTEGTNLTVDVASDGRFVTDLLGGIWVVPANGGEAAAVAGGDSPARRPRWSPDANSIAFEAHAPSGAEIWLYSVEADKSRRLSEGRYVDQHPGWHPDAERIVFSSARNDTDFD
ncbi:MAG: hypothetical protein QNJ00_04280, partial [Woeseiaceae bacterium]|nr:hypothetical protein [Woeseiaceae bacterium]